MATDVTRMQNFCSVSIYRPTILYVHERDGILKHQRKEILSGLLKLYNIEFEFLKLCSLLEENIPFPGILKLRTRYP